ncbi:MAG TPA: hypothetical protein VHR86_03705, partial [Armatimonadota bacterium]|nr:hypothetical protein [Armatimonadota bacterium]
MRRPFWKTPALRVVLVVGAILWILGHFNLEAHVDRARARNYTRRDKAHVTVDLIWPAPMNAMEKRYSFEAGARRALEEYRQQGGIFKHINLRVIPEFDTGLGRRLEKEANDPSVVAMLGFIASANNLKASVI